MRKIAGANEVIFTYYNTKIRKMDMESLQEGFYINDQIMTFYNEYLGK
jgi:Ulp1 family protease